ncbi:hypothetical protein DMENIID0001_148520 [Sergentomyia squamirostris]
MFRNVKRVNVLTICGIFIFLLFCSSNIIKYSVDIDSPHQHIEQIEISKFNTTKFRIQRTQSSNILFHDAVTKQWDRIKEEMRSFEYPTWPNQSARELEDFTLETGGIPIRSIVITKSRSGSSFLGDILNSVPGTFYNFEPLFMLHKTIIRNEGDFRASLALSNIRKLLQCDYSGAGIRVHLKVSKEIPFVKKNTRFWRLCEEYPKFCWRSDFHSEICRLFPLQSMKIIRLPLLIAGKLLDDLDLNVRIAYLIRDPRGVLQSRKHQDWCTGKLHCDDPSTVCGDLVADYNAAQLLHKMYPDRFRVVRYEDLCLNPYEVTTEILKFYGLPSMDPEVVKFLESHTKVRIGNGFSTYRDTKSAPFHWIKDLSYEEIDTIQRGCTKAMALWGYQKAINSSILSSKFDPLLPFSLT